MAEPVEARRWQSAWPAQVLPSRAMEAERKKENKETVLSGLLLLGTVTAILRQDTTSRMDLMEAVRKKEAEQLKVDMEAKDKTTQRRGAQRAKPVAALRGGSLEVWRA